ncbi:MAG: nucleotide exchange factor GrpE [Clostridiales Family XIII bacterium]|jgi:molecular chaperone GrpE|nr:nucleotide exchange factor GrpE [Clostridiales Family XIII bacterium]
MTTNKAKSDGAPQKKSAQTSASAKKSAAGPEKEAKRAPGGAREDAEQAGGAQEARPAGEAEPFAEQSAETEANRAAEPDGLSAPDDNAARDEDLNAKYMRLAADFQNYKRRVEKEKSEVYAYANEKIAIDILGVIDNFERALEAGGAEGREESFAKGMELIFKQLLDILSKNGVEEIQSLGEVFDPAVHHAVMMEETKEYESGRVSAVLGKGYRLKDRVIRPAMVKVAQ